MQPPFFTSASKEALTVTWILCFWAAGFSQQQGASILEVFSLLKSEVLSSTLGQVETQAFYCRCGIFCYRWCFSDYSQICNLYLALLGSDGCQTSPVCSCSQKRNKGTDLIGVHQHSHQWYKCVPTSLLYSFIHVFPKQFQVVLLSLRLNQYNCLSAPSIFISAEGRLFSITFYPLFHTFEEDLSLLLYFIKLPLLHLISTSFPWAYGLGGFCLPSVEIRE